MIPIVESFLLYSVSLCEVLDILEHADPNKDYMLQFHHYISTLPLLLFTLVTFVFLLQLGLMNCCGF